MKEFFTQVQYPNGSAHTHRSADLDDAREFVALARERGAIIIDRNWNDGDRKPRRPLGPDTVPHCRNHLQFRSDCEQCVSEREMSTSS